MTAISPNFIMLVIWGAVSILHSLSLSSLIIELNAETWLIIASIMIPNLILTILSLARDKYTLSSSICIIKYPDTLKNKENILLLIFTAIILFEAILSGGMPIFSIFGIGAEMTYAEFGIPSVHGLANSIYYSILTCELLKLNADQYGINKKILLLFLYPILGLSRQVLTTAIFICFAVNVYVKRSESMSLRKLILFLILFILIFGYLGDLRTGRDIIIDLASPTFDYPDWLPSGLMWIYIYLCTPLVNLNNNININPTFLPLESIGNIVPTVLKSYVLDSGGPVNQWVLANEAFNVSSYLQPIIMDFGVYLGAIFNVFLAVSSFIVYENAKKSASSFPALIFLSHAAFMSFFINFYSSIVFLFYFLIMKYIMKFKIENAA